MSDSMTPGIKNIFEPRPKLLRRAARLAATVCSLYLANSTPSALHAQSPPPTPSPTFDIASIKPEPWANEGGVRVFVRGNTLYGEHADLYLLVDFAYGLSPDNLRLSGGPAWARHGVLSNTSGFDSTLYQVVARAPDGPPPSLEQFRRMLQSLLAERFQLRVHHAMKDLPVFKLLVARDGSKLRENHSDAKASLSLRGGDGKPFRLAAVHTPVANLIAELTDPGHGVGRPVLDRTGLTGFYDFKIEWSPDDLAGTAPDASSADTKVPSVFTALQERLGLKLEPATAPYDTVVIDHAEKPSAN